MKQAVTKIALFIILSAMFFPFDQTVAPEWDVQTLDADRTPLPNVTVREVWQQHSVEESSHEEERKSDAMGRVHFDPRLHRSNLLQRAIGCAGRVFNAGVHATCGPKAHLVAFGENVRATDWQEVGGEQASTSQYRKSVLIAQRRP